METFPSLLQQHATQSGTRTALRMKKHGIWKSYTWAQVYSEVQKLACGFAATGLKPGDKVAVVGNNVPPLYFSILAAQSLGAVPVPIHADSSTNELKQLIQDCEARFAVLQDQQQVDAIYKVIAELPMLAEVVYFNVRGMQEYDHTHLKSYIEFEERGEKFANEHPGFMSDVASRITPETDAFVLYTSGTSGKARGAVLSHSNFLATAQVFADKEGITDQEEVYAYLPLCYASTMFFVYSLWMAKGYTINCPESNETILNDLREVGPTMFYAPPHFYRYIHAQINSRAENTTSYLRSRLLKTYMAKLSAEGRSWLGDKLVFDQIKDQYGLSHIKHAYVGGDVLSEEVFKFYVSLGINLKATYGSAESAGCISVQSSSDLSAEHSESMVGAPLPGIEVKVSDDQEIMFRGTNAFKGYYNDEAQTNAVIKPDGWVNSGDIGEIIDGHIHVIERMDSIGKFTSGVEFLPKQIENALKSSPYVKDAIVFGDNRDYMAAIIVINSDIVGAWAEMNGVHFTGVRELIGKNEVIELIHTEIKDINSNMSHVGGEACPPIKRFTILHRDFNVASGEITRSYKIKRKALASTNKEIVDSLFGESDKYQVTDSNGDVYAELRLITT